MYDACINSHIIMTTKTIPTQELTGAALDWAVASIERAGKEIDTDYKMVRIIYPNRMIERYDPSTNWSIAGPILEKNDWCLPIPNTFSALTHLGRYLAKTPGGFCYYGDTPLVAALRAFVAANLRHQAEVPEELL